MTKEYLSDKELQRLMDEAECAPLLAAPSYLKTEILHKADRIAAQRKGASAGIPVLPSSWRLAFYSLKMGFAAVAAVLVLLYIPMGPGDFSAFQPKFQAEGRGNIFTGITSMVDQKTNEFCGRLSELTNKEFVIVRHGPKQSLQRP
ncbi:MAG TPA: hypothetical protein DF613_16070 [Lachnospiraceae bacterium]|nr:hypothetical protein [Lachnospiraceae bacterium]